MNGFTNSHTDSGTKQTNIQIVSNDLTVLLFFYLTGTCCTGCGLRSKVLIWGGIWCKILDSKAPSLQSSSCGKGRVCVISSVRLVGLNNMAACANCCWPITTCHIDEWTLLLATQSAVFLQRSSFSNYWPRIFLSLESHCLYIISSSDQSPINILNIY